MEFDLQEFLRDMRDEHRQAIGEVKKENAENFRVLTEKVETVITRTNGHETRIVVVENMRSTVRWLTGSLVGSAIAGAFAWMFSMFHTGGAK